VSTYDVFIVGIDAGEGTLARHLAPSFKKSLLPERGDWLPQGAPGMVDVGRVHRRALQRGRAVTPTWSSTTRWRQLY